MRSETKYQADLVKKIKTMFPGCFVTRTDPRRDQGIPDILILFGDKWAMLEVKRSANEPTRPNQEYHVNRFNNLSFASFIYPENEEEVLSGLQSAFGFNREARVS